MESAGKHERISVNISNFLVPTRLPPKKQLSSSESDIFTHLQLLSQRQEFTCNISNNRLLKWRNFFFCYLLYVKWIILRCAINAAEQNDLIE